MLNRGFKTIVISLCILWWWTHILIARDQITCQTRCFMVAQAVRWNVSIWSKMLDFPFSLNMNEKKSSLRHHTVPHHVHFKSGPLWLITVSCWAEMHTANRCFDYQRLYVMLCQAVHMLQRGGELTGWMKSLIYLLFHWMTWRDEVMRSNSQNSGFLLESKTFFLKHKE